MNQHKKKYGIFMQVTPPTMLTEERWKKIDDVNYEDIDWRMQLIREGNPGKRFKVEELPETTEFTMASEDKEVNGKSLKDIIGEIKKLQPKVIPDNIPFIFDLIPGFLPSEIFDKKNEEGFSNLVKQLKALTEKGLAKPDKDVFSGLKNCPMMPKAEEFKGFEVGKIFDPEWLNLGKDNPFRLAVDKETDNDPSKLTINVRKVRKPEPEVDEKKELEAIQGMMEWSKERLATHGRTWENHAREHSQRAVDFENKNKNLTEKLTQTQFEKEALEKKNALLLEKMDDMFSELLAYRIEEVIQETEDNLRATYFVEPAEDNE